MRNKLKKSLNSVWERMVSRCHNPNNEKYRFYGGRGVVVCEEWRKSYKSFYLWAIQNGYSVGLQIDKDIKGNGKLYSPETCQFVTRKENQRARRHLLKFEYQGEVKTLVEICETLGRDHAIVRQRISRDKLTFNEAINRPTGEGVKHFPRKGKSPKINLFV